MSMPGGSSDIEVLSRLPDEPIVRPDAGHYRHRGHVEGTVGEEGMGCTVVVELNVDLPRSRSVRDSNPTHDGGFDPYGLPGQHLEDGEVAFGRGDCLRT